MNVQMDSKLLVQISCPAHHFLPEVLLTVLADAQGPGAECMGWRWQEGLRKQKRDQYCATKRRTSVKGVWWYQRNVIETSSLSQVVNEW